MPLTTASHDSLPYIDRPPTPSSLAAARALISFSLPPDILTIPHPLLPSAPTPHFSSLIESEISRIESKTPISGIDLSRYEASPETADASTLKAAYTNSTYLTKRLQALELLDQFGKNAWLIANSQLEDVLRGVERELVECRGSVEGINRERKGFQEGGRGGLEGGERGWREGLGRVVETEVAVGEVEGRWRERLRWEGRER